MEERKCSNSTLCNFGSIPESNSANFILTTLNPLISFEPNKFNSLKLHIPQKVCIYIYHIYDRCSTALNYSNPDGGIKPEEHRSQYREQKGGIL